MSDFPRKITTGELVSSRYKNNQKPESWDERYAGIDVINTTSGESLKLVSDGGQSPPQTGWVLMLTAGNEQDGFYWSLYGLPR